MKKNKLIFCADDWGFSPGINEGILELARRGLVYSVSLAANTDYLTHGLGELLALEKLGLKFNIHFNLTYKSPLDLNNKSLYNNTTGDFYNFSRLFFKSCTNQLVSFEVKKEFQEQLRILRELNIPITCLDGHQHIHLLPFIYKSIESSLKDTGICQIRYMNDIEHPLSFFQSQLFNKVMVRNIGNLKKIPTGYLLSKNLCNLEKKINKFERLIIHPAKFDDFLEKKMTDELRLERIIEYNKLVEFFNE